MSIVIGIDVGISTTKIVGIDEMKVVSPMRITAADPVTSLYGAFGKYLYENHIDLTDVEHVVLTGVGSAYIEKPVYGLPTSRADEFVADGLGARFESKLDHIIVVSMGTGTSLVLCNGSDIHHIGGISIGGGTLQGLSRIMLQTSDIRQVSELAKHGDISHVSLMIGDISAHPLPGLPMNVTASLFANAQTDASKEDIAVGLIHERNPQSAIRGLLDERHFIIRWLLIFSAMGAILVFGAYGPGYSAAEFAYMQF